MTKGGVRRPAATSTRPINPCITGAEASASTTGVAIEPTTVRVNRPTAVGGHRSYPSTPTPTPTAAPSG
jgi:hypothetical protein